MCYQVRKLEMKTLIRCYKWWCWIKNSRKWVSCLSQRTGNIQLSRLTYKHLVPTVNYNLNVHLPTELIPRHVTTCKIGCLSFELIKNYQSESSLKRFDFFFIFFIFFFSIAFFNLSNKRSYSANRSFTFVSISGIVSESYLFLFIHWYWRCPC